jgi:phosphatidylethanolamine-binding protein (PEBP) family uncharacterized protein
MNKGEGRRVLDGSRRVRKNQVAIDGRGTRRQVVLEAASGITRRSAGWLSVVSLLAIVFTSGCTAAASPQTPAMSAPGATASPAAPATIGTFEVSTAWPDNGFIPIKNTCEGDRTSPAITWQGAPAGTAEFVLIMETFGGNVSWVAVGIPGGSSGSLPEGGKGSTGGPVRATYQAPCPAPGQQQEYTLTLYALASPLAAGDLSQVAIEMLPPTLRDAMNGHELAEAVVTGWYRASINCEICGGTTFP